MVSELLSELVGHAQKKGSDHFNLLSHQVEALERGGNPLLSHSLG